MSDTFLQVYVHVLFAVKNRQALITKRYQAELYKYMTGIISNKNHKLLAINGMPDHVHLLINLGPASSLSELVREVKKSSTKFIREKQFSPFLFSWQAGYGAFSCSRSEVSRIASYIQNQEAHHRNTTFKNEYIDFLKKYDIDYKDEFLFDFFE